VIMTHLAEQINHLDRVSLNRSLARKCVYTYFINTPGMYIAEALKSYRSLDSYAPYHAAHVQTVVYLACMWCIMHVTADILKIS
jgi:predicted transcriptional regulator